MTDTAVDAAARSRYVVDPAVVRRLARRVVAGPRADTVTTTAPFTGAPLADLPMSTPDDVRVAVDAARAAQRAWSRRPLAERARPLLTLHDLVLDVQDELLDLIQLENGKARFYALEEVVGVIAPWNYPLTLAISDALPALVAGNGVVLKPDTQTAVTALRVLELLTSVGVAEGLVQVVLGDGAVVGSALVDAVDYVSFTGSTRTGRLVAERAGRRLVGASMELGGKNALYVADDADLGRAAEGAVRACFASTGQLCIGIERVLLHEAVADDFLERFLPRVRDLRLGAGLDFSAAVGSLTSPRQLEAVSRHVEDALAHGARVLAGGRARPDVG